MSYHNLVNEIINIQQQEIELYQRIAAGAPTSALCELIKNMIEDEKHELMYWKNFSCDGYEGGYSTFDAEEKE
ncbi:MAG: hypothetical protein K9L17_06005 [Clostridiales bacterium]|nr:hypothetical protein [Clostridiales bacterium]MCF8022226.1 hypothetical protein [Clostridiales bacterium]